jgi:hypothetical protein
LSKEYTHKQETIMYPSTSALDDFLYSQGLAPSLQDNFKLIDGQVEFVPTNPKLQSRKKRKKMVPGVSSKYMLRQNDSQVSLSQSITVSEDVDPNVASGSIQ